MLFTAIREEDCHYGDVVNELSEKEGIAVFKEAYEKFKKENPQASKIKAYSSWIK